jgi:hypothetical protein
MYWIKTHTLRGAKLISIWRIDSHKANMLIMWVIFIHDLGHPETFLELHSLASPKGNFSWIATSWISINYFKTVLLRYNLYHVTYHFKVYNSTVFNISKNCGVTNAITLRTYLFSPKQTLHTLIPQSPLPSPPTALAFSVTIHLPILQISYKMNHTMCVVSD